jgi:hypothetical protein
MSNISAKVDPATTKILNSEASRLKELFRAMFGADTKVQIIISNVPQPFVDYLNGHENAYTAQIKQEGFDVVLESKDAPLPF